MQFAHTALACLLITSLPMLFAPRSTLPPWPEMAVLAAGGAISGGAQLLLLAAFRRVGAATLAPLNYVQLLLAILISTLWFERPPDAPALLGMALIAIAGVSLARGRRPA